MGRRKGKLDAAWSEPLDILEVKGAVLTLRNPTTQKVVTIHSDKTVLLTPRLRPEHAQSARRENVLEADAVEELDVEDGNGLDAIDPVEPGASQPGALDFLKQPRAAGKRVPTVKNFSSNLSFVGMSANQESTTSTALRFDVVLRRSTPPASVTNLDDYYDLLPTPQQRADNRAPRPDLLWRLHHAVEDTRDPHHGPWDALPPRSALGDARSLARSKDVSLETHMAADTRCTSCSFKN